MLCPFEPLRHGFRFPNNFVNTFVIGRWKMTSTGRCGGMSYVSLDHYFGSVPVPDLTDLPALDTLLGAWIVRRQIHSLVNQGPRFAERMFNPFGRRTRTLFARCLPGGRDFHLLRRSIDAGRPVPLGLVAPKLGLTDTHHQVVAIGYEVRGSGPDAVRVQTYDPNYPDQVTTMIPDPDAQAFRTELPDGTAGHTWRTYFVDTRYRPSPVPTGNCCLPGFLKSVLC